MANFLLTAFLCFTGVSLALAAVLDWNYIPNDAAGPSNWGGYCNGSSQSPINIDSSAALYDSALGALTLVNYNSKPAGVKFTAVNDGHTLKVSFPDRMYNVSGGGLIGTYSTVQFHLHWGSTDSKGSEHTLDGKQFAAEIHFVSYNTKYADIGTALTHSDGLAVLGVFLKAGSSNAMYDKFLDSASSLVNKGSNLTLPAIFELQSLLPNDKTKYFRYIGSLTSPTCNEVVTWTVFNDPVEISTDQLDKLRALKINGSMPLVDNFRETQSIGSRIVKMSFKESDMVPTEPAGAIAVKISNVILLLMLFGALLLH